MGLIAQEIKELRQMNKHVMTGKADVEQANLRLKIYKEIHKRSKLVTDVFLACNAPHLVENRLHSLNIISKGEFVQISGDIEIEMVVCPDQGDKAITRAECLSYSGDTLNMEKCQSCNNFTITRNLLLSDKN